MKKILVLITIIALCFGFEFIVKSKIQTNYEKAQANELKRRAPIDIPDPSIMPIQEITDNTKPIIALFYVDWCGYCKRFMPIYGEVAKEYNDRYNFAVVHCEKPENKELVKEFEIRGFPSLFILDKKVNFKFPLLGSVTQDKKALEKQLDNYLNVRKNFAK